MEIINIIQNTLFPKEQSPLPSLSSTTSFQVSSVEDEMPYQRYAELATRAKSGVCKNDMQRITYAFIPVDVNSSSNEIWCFDIEDLRDRFMNRNDFVNVYTSSPFTSNEIQFLRSQFDTMNDILTSNFAQENERETSTSVHIPIDEYFRQIQNSKGELKGVTHADFVTSSSLGQGAHGVVKKARFRKYDHELALKTIKEWKLVQKEVDAYLAIGHHPNIIKFYGWFSHQINGGKVYTLVTEYIEGVDFKKYVDQKKNTVPHSKYIQYFYDICKAVKHCHDHDIVHYDIKLGNTMIDTKNDRGVLIDFDLATKGLRNLKQLAGTPNYIAPEILRMKDENRTVTYKIDTWSLGIMLFALCEKHHKPPFEIMDVKTTYRLIKGFDGDTFASRFEIDEKCKTIVKRFLQPDPENRIELGDALSLLRTEYSLR